MSSAALLLDRLRRAESAQELWDIEATFDALHQIADHRARLEQSLRDIAAMDPSYVEAAGIINRAKAWLAEIERE
jgi:hypothetical protein